MINIMYENTYAALASCRYEYYLLASPRCLVVDDVVLSKEK